MKNTTLLLGWIIILGCAACRKDELSTYDSPDNIYFNFNDADANVHDRDSLLYTFAYTPDKTADTIWLPIRISGNRLSVDRQFKLAVVPGKTTAVTGLHYAPIAEYYTLPADSGTARVPFIILNKDTAIQNRTVAVSLQLIQTEDFAVALPKLVTARIVFSNRLEKPDWWGLWAEQLGAYSRTKHELYLISVGNIDLVPNFTGTNSSQIPYDLYLIDKLRQFLKDPFAWLQEQTDYALTERSDGGYDFYSTRNPGRKIQLIHNDADGQYYFLDENGNRVTVNQ